MNTPLVGVRSRVRPIGRLTLSIPRAVILASAVLFSAAASCGRESHGPTSVVDSGGGRDSPASDADRHLVWSVQGPPGFGEPTVGEDAVYFLSVDHSLRAITKTDGVVRWTTQLPVQTSLSPGYGSLLLPERLIVADQDVFSIDPATGSIQWRFRAPIGRRPGYAAPVADAGTLYAGSGSGHLFAIDQTTGALRWVQAVGDSADGVFRPAVRDGVVYVGVTRFPPGLGQVGSRVVALDGSTGAIRWTRDLPLLAARPSSGTRGVVVVGTLVIAASGDGIIHALDITTGETRWTAPRVQWTVLPSPPDLDSRGLATDGARIYVSSGTGVIVALSPIDGAVIWTSPAALGAVFELRTDGRNVYAVFSGPLAVIDAANGSIRWSYDGVTTFAAAPNETFTGTASFDNLNQYVNGTKGFYAFRIE